MICPLIARDAAALIGSELFDKVRALSLELYAMGSRSAQAANLILADTKFEFGLDSAGELYLIDEVLTPDSSRYWPAQDYAAGRPQPSYDKQYVRDYLESLDWNKQAPAPQLPTAVLTGTLERYVEAYHHVIVGTAGK